MRYLLMVVVVTLLCGGGARAVGQAKGGDNRSERRTLIDVRKKADLGIDYSQTAKVKLASRQSSYRFGELISLDLALLNATDKRLFVDKPSGIGLSIEVVDENGKEVSVNPYTVLAGSPSPESYSLLEPNQITIGGFILLAGCNTEGVGSFLDRRVELARDVSAGRAEYDRGLFERDLFVNWGDACLRTTHPGKYSVTATLTNRWVVVSPAEPKVKTMVGTIRSTPLTITIAE
ncbi:MAG: hypothetical protein JOZ96_05975 [Acidobacteria bacterium]|nr:hypothetical protein [Acidobacteriota bacterium]